MPTGHFRRGRPCEIKDMFCTNPTQEGVVNKAAGAHGLCGLCGKVVCGMCSSMRKHKKATAAWGRVRMCNLCQVEYDQSSAIVYARKQRLAYLRDEARTP